MGFWGEMRSCVVLRVLAVPQLCENESSMNVFAIGPRRCVYPFGAETMSLVRLNFQRPRLLHTAH